MKIERQLHIILQVLRRGAGDTHPTMVVLPEVLLVSAWATPKKRALVKRLCAVNRAMADFSTRCQTKDLSQGNHERIHPLKYQRLFSCLILCLLIIRQPAFQLGVA